MAQWRRISSLAGSQPDVQKRLLSIYQRNKFNINVRGQLADAIENVDWRAIDADNVDVAMTTAQIQFQSLIMALDSKISASSHDFMTKMRLDQEKQNLQEQFSGNLLDFVKVLQNCMREEQLLIDSCESDSDDRRPIEERAKENPILTAKIQEFRNALTQAETELTHFSNHQSKFRIDYTNYTEKIVQLSTRAQNVSNMEEQTMLLKEVEKLKTAQTEGVNNNYLTRLQIDQLMGFLRNSPNGMDRKRNEKEVERLDKERSEMSAINFNFRMNVGRKQQQLADQLGYLIKKLVWVDIDIWKNEMKLSFTGLTKPKEGALDILDNVCLRVNDLLMQMLSQMDKVISVFNDLKYESADSPDEWIPKMNIVRDDLSQLLSTHLAKIFVVDRFPRILKVITAKSLGFTMTCRLLGAHSFNLQTMPNVTAELHKEQDVMSALKERRKGICEVVNGKDKPMDFIRTPKQVIGNFNSVQLQKVKQLDKSSDKLVMENRFGMVFYTSVKIRERAYNLCTYSQPMALISHVLQECMARAFLIWDAAFSKSDSERIPFDHPNEVPWGSVAKVLDALFKENTGRGLTPDQLNYLGRVAFKEKKAGDYSKRKISKSALIKDRVQKDFSFWKWFYASMNLIKERLKDEWNDGLIHGFISKEEILDKLLKCEPGTFMLRFSERTIENSSRADICGCLTLGVIDIDPDTESPKIFHVKEHLSPKDIYERGLAQTLEAFEVKDYRTGKKRPLLTNLYPNLRFITAFQKYLNKRHTDDQDGYRSGQLRIEIFLTEDTNMIGNDHHMMRDKKVILPMSPISSVGMPSPAPSDFSNCTTDFDDNQPFSPLDSSGSASNGPRAIAMVAPTMSAVPTNMTAAQLQSLSLSPAHSDISTSSGTGSHYRGNSMPTPMMMNQPGTSNSRGGSGTIVTPMETVEVLPPHFNRHLAEYNQMGQIDSLETNAANAALHLLEMNSGEINSGGDLDSGGSGSGVTIDINGDVDLPQEAVQRILEFGNVGN